MLVLVDGSACAHPFASSSKSKVAFGHHQNLGRAFNCNPFTDGPYHGRTQPGSGLDCEFAIAQAAATSKCTRGIACGSSSGIEKEGAIDLDACTGSAHTSQRANARRQGAILQSTQSNRPSQGPQSATSHRRKPQRNQSDRYQ